MTPRACSCCEQPVPDDMDLCLLCHRLEDPDEGTCEYCGTPLHSDDAVCGFCRQFADADAEVQP